MIFNVRGLDDELNALRLNAGLMLDMSRLGYIPPTPKSVTMIMKTAEENQALSHCSRRAKSSIPIGAQGRKRNDEQAWNFHVIVIQTG